MAAAVGGGRAYAQSATPSGPNGNEDPGAIPEDTQRIAIARALFQEGLQFVDDERWAEAADRFSRVLEIRYSAVAAYNLGLARAHLGKLVSASETLRKLLTDEALDPKVRESVSALLTDVEAKQAHLSIALQGDCIGCSVWVDDQSWPSAAIGIAAPIDPGEHVVELRNADKVLQSQRLAPREGQREEVTLGSEPVAPTPAAVAASTQPTTAVALTDAEPEQRAHGSSILSSPWFWIGVGVVAAGATAIAIAASSGGGGSATPVAGDFSPGVVKVKL